MSLLDDSHSRVTECVIFIGVFFLSTLMHRCQGTAKKMYISVIFSHFFCHSIHFSCQLDYIMIRLGHYLFVCWLLILFVCFNRFIDTLSTVQSVMLACVRPASRLSQEEAFYLFFSKLTLDNKFFACFLIIIY